MDQRRFLAVEWRGGAAPAGGACQPARVDADAAPPFDRAATAEGRRLAEADADAAPWRRWGPYLAERAWGTVREDYSADGDAWRSFPYEHAGVASQDEAVHHPIDQGVVYVFAGNRLTRYG